MNAKRVLKHLGVLALLPLFAFIFWAAAAGASTIPSVLTVAVNVHGLNLTSDGGDSGQPLAPLAPRVLLDAQQDAIGAARTSAAGPGGTPEHGPAPAPSPSSSGLIPLPVQSPPLGGILGPSQPQAASISGQVTDSQTRLPIVAATISLSPGGESALTDANGDYGLGVAPGTYTVTASATGYASASQLVSVNSGQKATANFRLVSISAYGSLRGTVLDSLTQAPIAGATVLLSSGMIRVTDASGNFEYAIALSGTYTLTVAAVGYVTQSQSVTIRAGHTTTVGVALVRG